MEDIIQIGIGIVLLISIVWSYHVGKKDGRVKGWNDCYSKNAHKLPLNVRWSFTRHEEK